MTSKFLLQIVDKTSGKVVQFEPGKSVEIDLVEDCVKRILTKGVGLLKTEAHVEQDIRDGISEAIKNLKAKI